MYKQNVLISLRLSDSASVREVYIFELERYISALEQTRMLILSNYVLLACINTIYKYGPSFINMVTLG